MAWNADEARARLNTARVDYATYIRLSRIHYGQMDDAATQQLREGFVAEQRYLVWRNDEAVADLTAALDALTKARAEAEALAAALREMLIEEEPYDEWGKSQWNQSPHVIRARAALTAATPAGTGQEG